MSVSGEIKEYMKRNGVKQTFIAQKMGIRDSKISTLLASKDLRISDYMSICDALGVSYDFFLSSNSEFLGNSERRCDQGEGNYPCGNGESVPGYVPEM